MEHEIHESLNCTNNNTFTVDKANWLNKMKIKITICKNSSKIPRKDREKRRKIDTTNTYSHAHCFDVFFFILALFWGVFLYLYIDLRCSSLFLHCLYVFFSLFVHCFVVFSIFVHCLEVFFFIYAYVWGVFLYVYIVLMCFSLFVHWFKVFFLIPTLFCELCLSDVLFL